MDRCAKKSTKEASDETLKNVYKIFKYYRFDVGGRYNSREFALPDRLKYFPLYLATILSKPCLNPKSNFANLDFNYYSMIKLV